MPEIDIDPDSTAVLITDPQKDFLSPDGVAWEMVGDTVEQNRVVEKLERLRDTARKSNIPYSTHRATSTTTSSKAGRA